MARKLARWGVVLLLAAPVLGVSGADGKSLATTTLIVQVIGGGTVSGGGGQINCGAGSKSCYATYVSGSAVTLTAAAPVGWTFSGWDDSDDCSGSSTTCSVPLNGTTQEEIAEFTPITPVGTSTLTVTEPDGGTVSALGDDIDCGTDNSDCDVGVTTDSTLTLLETPDAGYSFTGWGGGCTGTANSCTVTMSVDRSVSAAFAQSPNAHVLTVSVTGNGTVTGGGIACTSAGGSGCSASQPAGSQVTLTATAGSGASFNGWGGACAGTSTTCQVTMTGDLSVTAAFSGGTGSTVPLTLSVSGNGKVTGGGIDCGNGATTCNANVAIGSSITLTAIPASGAVFQGWGGECSGTAQSCTVTMSAAKAVSATFNDAGSPPTKTVTLTLRVGGNGVVSAPGGSCAASGATKTCAQSYPTGASIVLTATARTGARFVGWSGGCTGTRTTCTLALSAAKTVTATFTGASAPSGVLRSTGRPIVERTENGFAVTLRFNTPQRGTAHVRAVRAGRVMTSFSRPIAAGQVKLGPFRLANPGYYTFEVALGSSGITWTACLGRCGAAAGVRAFTVTRDAANIRKAGAVWSVTVHFRTTLPAGVRFAVYRGTTLALDYRFAPPAGPLSAGPFLLSPGNYTLRLTAIDAYGRLRTLRWFAFLP